MRRWLRFHSVYFDPRIMRRSLTSALEENAQRLPDGQRYLRCNCFIIYLSTSDYAAYEPIITLLINEIYIFIRNQLVALSIQHSPTRITVRVEALSALKRRELIVIPVVTQESSIPQPEVMPSIVMAQETKIEL